jgi:hypothetical protein
VIIAIEAWKRQFFIRHPKSELLIDRFDDGGTDGAAIGICEADTV